MAPYVVYNQVVEDFIAAIYSFIDTHKEMGLYNYNDILSESGIKWNAESMKSAEVASLDGRTAVALIFAAIRADRFCEGALLASLTDGSIIRWLSRLKEIDETKGV